MIAAVYARKSDTDERSAADGRSVDRQVELARAFAAKTGWAVNEQFVLADERSGADFTRPGLVKLLDAARQRPRPFDVVIVMAIDRLGREQVRTASVVQQLHAAGVHVYTYQDQQRVKFDTPVEKLMVGIHNFGAEDFRYQIKLKTAEALRRKAARGHATGARTYGYGLVRKGEHTERVVDEAQAAVVRRIFEMSAAGLGDNRITNILAAERVAAPGPSWGKPAVRRMLQNPLYRGVAVYGRTRTVDDGAHGKRVRVQDAREWITVDIPELRIVSDELWQRVQQRKEQTRAHYLRAVDGTLLGKPESGLIATKLLNGIGRCGSCDGALNVMGNLRVPRYFCLTRNRRGPAACSNGHGVPMREFDEAVMEQIYDTLHRKPEVAAALIEDRLARARRDLDGGQERENADKEVAKLEAEISRLVNALAAGTPSPDIVQAINARRARVEEIRAAVQPEPAPFDRMAFLERMKSWSLRGNPLLYTEDPVFRRQMLRRLGVDKVVVHRELDGSWSWESALDARRLLIYMESPELSVMT